MDGSPLSSDTSRIGTRTPCAPSTNTFVELGNAVANSDIPHSLRRFEPDQVPRVYLNPGIRGYPWRLSRHYSASFRAMTAARPWRVRSRLSGYNMRALTRPPDTAAPATDWR